MLPVRDVVIVGEKGKKVGTGWLPPVPDLRDYSPSTPRVAEAIEAIGLRAPLDKPPADLPSKVDLRQWCSEISDQGNLGSCTAHAGVGIVEYLENRGFKKHIDGSPLFVYKATRNLLGWTGDTGAWLRTTMGAIVMLGVPPATYYPYIVSNFDNEPSSFVYSLANDFAGTSYFCHDPMAANLEPDRVLASVKSHLSHGVPSMFGFYGFSSFGDSDVIGGIPYPGPDEWAQWGHAIDAVGYDDALQITNTRCNITTTGALLIRNSWGEGWGDHGYGWLPYKYVLSRYATDFWSLFGMRYVDTGQFGLSA